MLTIGIIAAITAIILLLAGLPIYAVIGLLTIGLNFVTPVPIIDALGLTAWAQSQSYVLVSIPLFILFGEILVRSGIAGEMYNAIAPWLNRVPGKLMQTNVATASIFAATSGSSVATAATIAAVAIPEIKKYGYNEPLFLGSIAAGGTLGILIPPSINLIVYGSITNTSIPDLYLAGMVPGLILALFFMLTTAIACTIRPHWDGSIIESSWGMRLRSFPTLLPPIGLFLIIVGSIYAGIATPTEAAALGVVATLALVAIKKRLTWHLLNKSLLAAARITSMLMLIMIAAAFLNFALGFLGFSNAIESIVENLNLSPYAVIGYVVLLYLMLGMFLDGLSMTVLTVPVLTPLVMMQGFDPIWFGIIVVIVTEAGLLTPPVGMNCYVVQGVRGRGSLNEVFLGVSPYVIALFAVLGLLIYVPNIVLWYQ